LSLIIDNVLNSYLALCQSQPHCRSLLVPANFHEIVEDAEDIQQFANHKRKEKRVPINSDIQPVIERLLQQNKESKYLFVNPRTGTRFTKIYNAWTTVLKKAGLDGTPGVDKIRIHDLRHNVATKLARAGKDAKFIAQMLGHRDVKTTYRYIHHDDEDLKEGAEILARVPSYSTTPIVADS